MKNIDLPLEIRTKKKKNECIDIKEIEHEGGGNMEREKKVSERSRETKKKGSDEKERWPL